MDLTQTEEKIMPDSKTRDLGAIWTEFNQLAAKYNSQNFCHGLPGLPAPEFLLDAFKEAVDDPRSH